MKKKMAIVLSLVLACSMSMTAFAAPSPSLNTGNTPAEQIVVDSSVTGTTAQAGVGNVTGPLTSVTFAPRLAAAAAMANPILPELWLVI